MNKADLIKQRLTIDRLVERLGIEPDRSGYIQCPAHQDKHPSLKIYGGSNKGWFCYSCNAGGSVIDFYMHYMRVDFKNAVSALGSLCGLDGELSTREKIELKRMAQARNQTETNRMIERSHYLRWLKYTQTLEKKYNPDLPYPPELVEACQNIAHAEYLAFERR